jgi:hypothetical protein
VLTLISLLSFLLPTQLAFHFNNFQNSVYGFNIDYLIPTLYLTDIVAVLIIALGVRKIKFSKSYMLYAISYMVFMLLNIYISDYFISSLYKWLKVTEMILLGTIIFNTKKFDVFKHFVKPLSYSTVIVCVLGILQHINRGSIGGFFYALGERAYLYDYPNIAPYPYSTFSHPNSFAGFLLVFGIFLIQFKSKFRPNFFWSLITLTVINLVLTNSLNVYFTIVFLIILKFKNNIGNLLFIDLSQRFVTHRIELIKASLQMIKENFWLGVGLNNFIPNLVKVSNTYLNSWELQPVHNIFLLVFSETGIIGLYAFCFMLYATLTAYNLPLIAILFTGLSDHYWITLQQNILLFVFTLVIARKNKKNHI